jgi:hypothetical protein
MSDLGAFKTISVILQYKLTGQFELTNNKTYAEIPSITMLLIIQRIAGLAFPFTEGIEENFMK